LDNVANKKTNDRGRRVPAGDMNGGNDFRGLAGDEVEHRRAHCDREGDNGR
jgi:hypothetical protein